MFTKRAARATPRAALVGAPEIAADGHRLPRAGLVCVFTEYQRQDCKGGWALGAARLCSAEKRRACGRARSALRNHSRRACLNAVHVAHVVSCATGRKTEHRRKVGRSTDRYREGPRLVPTRPGRE